MIRAPNEPLSQFLHGNVHVKPGNLFIAMVFRHVNTTLPYHFITCKRVLDYDYLKSKGEYFAKLDKEYAKYQDYLTCCEVSFSDQVKAKIRKWRWSKMTLK